MSLLSALRKKFKKKGRTRHAAFRDYRSANTHKTRKRPINPKIKTQTKSKKGHKKQRYKAVWKWMKIIIFLAIIIFLLRLLFFSKYFAINSVEVNSDSDFILEEKQAVTLYLQNVLGDNLLSFNSQEHENYLLKEYPNIKSIKIKKDFPRNLLVNLESYSDSANIQITYEDGGKQFFIVNELGIISSVGASNEYLPTIVMDVTGTDLEIKEENSTLILGETLLSQEILEKLLETEKDFESKFNVQVLEVYYLKRAREVHLYTERDFFVWIDLTQDIGMQLNKLKKAMTKLNIYEEPLLYIDLRISGQNGEKVIYKVSE